MNPALVIELIHAKAVASCAATIAPPVLTKAITNEGNERTPGKNNKGKPRAARGKQQHYPNPKGSAGFMGLAVFIDLGDLEELSNGTNLNL